MKLLEKNNVAQTVFDGARLNKILLQNKNGILLGCDLAFTAQKILVSKGLLTIEGFRVVFDNEDLLTMTVLPSSLTKYVMAIRLTVANADILYELVTNLSTEAVHDDILTDEAGAYEYPLCEYYADATGIIQVVTLARKLNFTVWSYDDTEIRGLLPGKADLVNGKLKLDQLPYEADDTKRLASITIQPATVDSVIKKYFDVATGHLFEHNGTDWVDIGTPDPDALYIYENAFYKYDGGVMVNSYLPVPASQSAAQAGTDTTGYITPSTLKAVMDARDGDLGAILDTINGEVV
jgi:hypothetical protein